MKNNIKKYLLAAAGAGLMLTACDIERLPNGSMAAESITSDPDANLESLVRGAYAQLKTWSDPMHRLGEYAGDNMMIRFSALCRCSAAITRSFSARSPRQRR